MEQSNVNLPEKPYDEIDLTDLFKRMGRIISRFCRALGRAFLTVFFFAIRKSLYLFLSLLIGIGISYLLKRTSERLYTSTITLRSNTVPNSQLIQYLNNLYDFTRTENYEALSSALNLPFEKAESLLKIQAFWLIDRGGDGIPDHVDFRNNHNALDTINFRMQDRLVIRVRTTIPQAMNSIRDGIISYIENNALYQQQNALRLQQNEVMLARVNYDITQLDSLQKVKYFEETRQFFPRDGGQMIFLQEQHRTQLLHEDIYSLYARKQQMEQIQTLYADLVTVLFDFSPSSRADNRLGFYAKWVVPITMVLCILLLIFFDKRRKFMELYQKY